MDHLNSSTSYARNAQKQRQRRAQEETQLRGHRSHRQKTHAAHLCPSATLAATKTREQNEAATAPQGRWVFFRILLILTAVVPAMWSINFQTVRRPRHVQGAPTASRRIGAQVGMPSPVGAVLSDLRCHALGLGHS